jgi:hypothetical protein
VAFSPMGGKRKVVVIPVSADWEGGGALGGANKTEVFFAKVYFHHVI